MPTRLLSCALAGLMLMFCLAVTTHAQTELEIIDDEAGEYSPLDDVAGTETLWNDAPLYAPGPPAIGAHDPNWIGPWKPGKGKRRIGARLRKRFFPTTPLARMIEHGRTPLVGQSWIHHPFSAGVFVGGLWGDDLIEGAVTQKSGPLAGLRLGWDFDLNWGLETRFGFANVNISDPTGVNRLDDNSHFVWDASLLYYPWADTLWRPYLLAGVGLADIDFVDGAGFRVHDTVLGMPVGLGIKFRLSRRLILRFEVLDNIAFGAGSGVDSTHNVSLTGGLELRFGGVRTSYWPWDPGRDWW